jgi:hypothetical protein
VVAGCHVPIFVVTQAVGDPSRLPIGRWYGSVPPCAGIWISVLTINLSATWPWSYTDPPQKTMMARYEAKANQFHGLTTLESDERSVADLSRALTRWTVNTSMEGTT